MIIRYPDGSYVEGVIQRLERGTLRATLAGVDDAVEYTLIEDGWTSEMGEGVTFEFTMHREVDCWLGMIEEGTPVCAAGGGECVLRQMPGSDGVRVN